MTVKPTEAANTIGRLFNLPRIAEVVQHSDMVDRARPSLISRDTLARIGAVLANLTPRDISGGVVNTGAAGVMAGLAGLGLGGILKDPNLVQNAQTLLTFAGLTFGSGAIGCAATDQENPDPFVMAIRDKFVERVQSKAAKRDVLAAEVAMLRNGLPAAIMEAGPDPEENAVAVRM